MSTPDIIGFLVAAGLGAILLEIVRSFLQRRQMGADAAKVITEAATTLLIPLQARIVELETKLSAALKRLATCEESLDAADLRTPPEAGPDLP